MNVWQGRSETLREHSEAALLLGRPVCGCQRAMSAVGRGLGNGNKKVSPNISGLSQPFNCMFCCCYVFSYEAFGGPGACAGMKYNKVSSSFPSGDTLLQCAKSARNVNPRPVALRSAQRAGAAGINSVCFLGRRSIDLLHLETCSWVSQFQQAVPLSLATISKSPGNSSSIWLSL